jgi:anti-sigma-K factor RskA
VKSCLLALAAILATVLFGRVAFADAAPVQLVLLYMPNVSNTGTSSATGIAELVMSEGEVRIKTADLPRLDDGKQYVAWAVNSQTNEFARLGNFNTAESTGAVDYENVLPDTIPNKHWNLLLITVEDGPNAARPGSHHSIAGVFPSPDNAPLPVALPNTGGDPDADYSPLSNRADWLAPLVLGALTLSGTFGAGYALGLKKR